jgi:glutamate--cysteine ligase
MIHSTEKVTKTMLTYDDLVNDMASGCKPKQNWRIGIEHEQFVFNKATHESLPYDGAPGIKQILQGLTNYGWNPVEANGHLIALARNGSTVTLEPGGQIEFSGSPLATTGEVRAEADHYYSDLQKVTESLGVGILAVGFHPSWTRAQIHRMPKERYDIMAPYMEKTGKYGLDMMLRTCGAQVNLDFDSEYDMVKKYRVALGLQPVMTALLANSTHAEGRNTGYQSYRSLMWTNTDPDRCGVPQFVFEKDMGFARYVDYALDVPMYFFMRDGHHINVVGQSFRAFMEGKLPGHEGEYPTTADWHDHLSVLYPEVRLKTYLELRGPDSVAPPLVYAMTSFWVGIFYDEAALDQAWDLIRDWPPDLHQQIRLDVARDGLHTKLPERQTLLNMAMEAIEIATHGLSRVADEQGGKVYLSLLSQKILESAAA